MEISKNLKTDRFRVQVQAVYKNKRVNVMSRNVNPSVATEVLFIIGDVMNEDVSKNGKKFPKLIATPIKHDKGIAIKNGNKK